jgi:hypothetical protein
MLDRMSSDTMHFEAQCLSFAQFEQVHFQVYKEEVVMMVVPIGFYL